MKIIIGASGGIGKKLFDHYWGKQEVAYGTFFSADIEESEFMYKLDVTSPEWVMDFVDSIDLYDGQIDLINCAGINYDAMAHKTDPLFWRGVINTNLIGTYNVISGFLPFMRKHN